MSEPVSRDARYSKLTAHRNPKAFSVVLIASMGENKAQLRHVLTRATNVENRMGLNRVLQMVLTTFLHPPDSTLPPKSALHRFDASHLDGDVSSTFPCTVDTADETVTVILSPTVTMTVFRKRKSVLDPVHFRLVFQDPKEGAEAMARYQQAAVEYPEDTELADCEYEPAITITAKRKGRSAVSEEATLLLGDRLRCADVSPRRYHTATIVPKEGERLVVFGNTPAAYALGLMATRREQRREHADANAFASVVLPDGSCITLAYRKARKSPNGRRLRTDEEYDCIVAYEDVSLTVVPQDDPWHEDRNWGDPSWR